MRHLVCCLILASTRGHVERLWVTWDRKPAYYVLGGDLLAVRLLQNLNMGVKIPHAAPSGMEAENSFGNTNLFFGGFSFPPSSSLRIPGLLALEEVNALCKFFPSE